MTREQWTRLSPQQRAAYAARRAQPAQHKNATAPKPGRRPGMPKSAALGVITLGALVIGGIGGVVLTRMVSPVLAFADSTQSQAIQSRAIQSRAIPAAAAVQAKHVQAKPVAVNHCADNRADQLVLVSLTAQHAWFCAATKTVYQTDVTTGRAAPGARTPVGHFTIRAKVRDTVLTPDTGEQYPVQYWIPFQGSAYGFHDAGWQNIPFGSSKYTTAGSHGCVHLPLPAVRYLYAWARVGAHVTIS